MVHANCWRGHAHAHAAGWAAATAPQGLSILVASAAQRCVFAVAAWQPAPLWCTLRLRGVGMDGEERGQGT
jgi:hypothetical protein